MCSLAHPTTLGYDLKFTLVWWICTQPISTCSQIQFYLLAFQSLFASSFNRNVEGVPYQPRSFSASMCHPNQLQPLMWTRVCAHHWKSTLILMKMSKPTTCWGMKLNSWVSLCQLWSHRLTELPPPPTYYPYSPPLLAAFFRRILFFQSI